MLPGRCAALFTLSRGPSQIVAGLGRRGRLAWLGLLFAVCLLLAPPIIVHAQSSSPPLAPSPAIVLSIPENSPPGLAIGAPVSAQASAQVSDIVSYSLVGEDAEFFDIDRASGQLKTRMHLDYEARPEYIVTVGATDRSGFNATFPVAVRVVNVDEAAVVFLSPPIVQVGAELSATLADPDGAISEERWQWAVSPDKVTWRAISGADSASYLPVATRTREFLRAQVSYTDGHGPGKSAETIINTSLGSPSLNFAPEFPHFESGVRSVSKDILPYEFVGRAIVASDLDGDTLTYFLSGDAAQVFDIEGHSGQLVAKAFLPSPLESRYFGEVHVSDGRGGEASLTVRVDVPELQAPIVVAVEPEPTPAPAPAVVEVPEPVEEPVAAPTAAPARAVAGPAGLGNAPAPTPVPRAVPAVQTTAPKPTAAPKSAAAGNPRPEPTAAPRVAEPTAAPALAAAPSAIPPSSDGDGGLWAAMTSYPTSLLWTLLPAALLAVFLWLRWLHGRNREREVVLPPPSFGVERRLGSMNRATSGPRDEESPRRDSD